MTLCSLDTSDGLPCFSAVNETGYKHISIVTGRGAQSATKEEFTWINTMIGNVKNAITGTYHDNRRFQLEDMLPRFAYVAVRTAPMPIRLLNMA